MAHRNARLTVHGRRLHAGRCVWAGDAVYLDAAATGAWIAHPDFHVVK
ncbi:hypothetical protein [Micromonospora sp. NPDC047730]